jgi:hypothetical protein
MIYPVVAPFVLFPACIRPFSDMFTVLDRKTIEGNRQDVLFRTSQLFAANDYDKAD